MRSANESASPASGPASMGARSVTTAGKSQAYKVILSGPVTADSSLVATNLSAVAVGTLKVFVWVTTIFVVLFFGFIGGLIKGARSNRRRGSWL